MSNTMQFRRSTAILTLLAASIGGGLVAALAVATHSGSPVYVTAKADTGPANALIDGESAPPAVPLKTTRRKPRPPVESGSARRSIPLSDGDDIVTGVGRDGSRRDGHRCSHPVLVSGERRAAADPRLPAGSRRSSSARSVSLTTVT